ncbi:MAG: PCRF domain-containing protein [Candidatus Sungbacteria bacterium]|uniref:PCRF domain-containing protein n=1 Tax=Candidatus Sungiibacteriota bacterium TaxID=2750080 RepID=A0A932DS09_9BACT|nr:PCRF domain-containing protein [Candidatus Sungbacteria bacterium]
MEAETTLEDFWKDRLHYQKISRDLADLKDLTEKWENYQNDLKHLAEVAEIFEDLADKEQLFKEFKRALEKLETELEKEKTLVYLSGRYDKSDAIITIYSGAGGTDAQEWVEMLLRMYLKYAEKAGFRPQVVAVTSGGEAGLKNAIMEIRGRYAYGYLKRENGVHRLVRVSPFSSQNLRHTSFALVEVLPELDDVSAIEIKPEDIKRNRP